MPAIFPPLSGMQAFNRAANIYGQPDETVQAPVADEEVHAKVGGPMPDEQYYPGVTESVTAPVGPDPNAPPPPPMSTTEAFRQSALAGPPQSPMEYPANTLSGFQSAMKVAAEPSPLAGNRVWLDGKPYQKNQVVTDAQGVKHYMSPVHEPAFMDQVMKAMAGTDMSSYTNILNQPGKEAQADWEAKNKALTQAATAEAQIGLANQRNATADITPRKQATAEDIARARTMDAENRKRLADLKIKTQDLTESQKQALVLQRVLSLQDLRDIDALDRVEEQQKGATARNTATNLAAGQRNAATIAGAAQRETSREAAARKIQELRGTQAIATKGAPSGAGGSAGLRIAQLGRMQQILDQHPEWDDYLTVNEDTGMPDIKPVSKGEHWWDESGPPDQATYDQIYSQLYGIPIGQQVAPPKGQVQPPQGQQTQPNAPPTNQQQQPITNPAAPLVPLNPKAPPQVAPGSPNMPAPVVPNAPAGAQSVTGPPANIPPPNTIPMTTPDGRGVRYVSPQDYQTAYAQGYRVKGQ